jgi:hypothetical protein
VVFGPVRGLDARDVISYAARFPRAGFPGLRWFVWMAAVLDDGGAVPEPIDDEPTQPVTCD